MEVKNKPYFRHFIIELECPFKMANSLTWIKAKTSTLIKELDIEVLQSMKHLFKPQGISLLYIISSSHMAVHTWPENNYIHIELLTCSKTKKLDNIGLVIKKVFPKFKSKVMELDYY